MLRTSATRRGKTRSRWKPTTELNIQTRSLSLLFSSSLSRPHSPAPARSRSRSLGWLQVALYLIKPPSCPCLATSHHINIQSFDGDAFQGGGPARIIHQEPLLHYAMFLSIQGHYDALLICFSFNNCNLPCTPWHV